MEAAERAGVVYQQIEVIPYAWRCTLGVALVDDSIMEEFHSDLFTGRRLAVPRLHDASPRQVTRLDMGGYETEPVGDSRLPVMPIKCFGGTPLVMLPDGRVRRTLLTEFAEIGSMPLSVDRGMGQEPAIGETKAAKTMIGNTWEPTAAALAYMQPFLSGELVRSKKRSGAWDPKFDMHRGRVDWDYAGSICKRASIALGPDKTDPTGEQGTHGGPAILAGHRDQCSGSHCTYACNGSDRGRQGGSDTTD